MHIHITMLSPTINYCPGVCNVSSTHCELASSICRDLIALEADRLQLNTSSSDQNTISSNISNHSNLILHLLFVSLFAFCCRGWLTTSSPPSQMCGHLVSSWQTDSATSTASYYILFLFSKVKESTHSTSSSRPSKVFFCGRSPPMGCLPIRGLNSPKSMRWAMKGFDMRISWE